MEAEPTRVPGSGAAAAEPYELDPLLREAWDYYADWRNRRREVAIGLFERYLAETPDSVFRPEILSRIGHLYCSNVNRQFGEEPNLRVASEYFVRAHKEYGERWCVENATAWASLAALSGQSLGFRLSHYDWLARLHQEGEARDVYPIRRISQCLDGLPPIMEARDVEVRARGMQRWLAHDLAEAEKAILEKATPGDLCHIAARYPDTELAREAAAAYDRLHSRFVDEVLQLPCFADVLVRAGSQGISQSSFAAASPVPPPHPPVAPPTQALGTGDRPVRIGLALLAGVAGAAMAVTLLVGRRKEARRTEGPFWATWARGALATVALLACVFLLVPAIRQPRPEAESPPAQSVAPGPRLGVGETALRHYEEWLSQPYEPMPASVVDALRSHGGLVYAGVREALLQEGAFLDLAERIRRDHPSDEVAELADSVLARARLRVEFAGEPALRQRRAQRACDLLRAGAYRDCAASCREIIAGSYGRLPVVEMILSMAVAGQMDCTEALRVCQAVQDLDELCPSDCAQAAQYLHGYILFLMDDLSAAADILRELPAAQRSDGVGELAQSAVDLLDRGLQARYEVRTIMAAGVGHAADTGEAGEGDLL
jgi:hypothetical protein